MKKILCSILFAALCCINAQAAPALDMSKVSGCEVYTMEVGGQPQEGVLERLSLSLPAYRSAVAFASPRGNFDAYNQLQPWYATDITNIFEANGLGDLHVVKTPQNEVFFLALELEEGGYMVIQPISALNVMSWIEIKAKDSIDVVCGSMGVNEVESSTTPIFAYATGDDFYGALYQMWGDILVAEQVEGRTQWRDNKSYPESFKYLGWCSWEQYRKNIYESLLVEAVDILEESEIPVRWVLVDDGHQTKMKDGTLLNFEVSAEKFPNGWAPIIDKRSDKIKWFGLWHCMYGDWSSISVDHTMRDMDDYMIPVSKKAMIISEDPRGSEIFYDKMISSVGDPGFDFAKIDVQTHSFANYVGRGNPVITHRQNAENLEKQCLARLDGGLINCMASNLPCIFNTRNSAVTRVSVDYKVNNPTLAVSHIFQSYHNSALFGQTIWPDHDMFHSSDVSFGRFMAVSKAMSGAPIYLSDAPGEILAEMVLPLAYSDGELLRPLAPGVPLPGSFFSNALMGSDSQYGVIAPMSATSAAVVIYNISCGFVDGMECVVSAKDYTYADAMVQPYPGLRTLPKEGLVYYDWYEGKGGKLNGDYRFTLDNVKDKLVLLSEIESGWSVIGLEEKYLSGVAVESVKTSKKSIEITVKEAGAILVYSSKPIKRASQGEVAPLGDGFYRVSNAGTTVTLYR